MLSFYNRNSTSSVLRILVKRRSGKDLNTSFRMVVACWLLMDCKKLKKRRDHVRSNQQGLVGLLHAVTVIK